MVAKKTTAKKTTAAKPAAKKAPVRKTTAAKRTTAAKKTTARKTTAAKPAAKKAPAKKVAAKKAPVKKAPAKKAPAKKAPSKGYRPSEWDTIVIDTLNKRKKVSVFADFMDAAKASGTKLSDQDLYRRINQSLHKLANKRGDLIKVPKKGRGFAYGLPEWKSGRGVGKQYKAD